MPLDELPRIDEHCVDVAAPPDLAWDAAAQTLGASLSGPLSGRLARLLGCDPAVMADWEEPDVGSSVPGFRIAVAERPRLLVVSGCHRFSRYGIVFRVVASGDGSRCCAESRAAFPGLHGRLYRLAVIGTGTHRVAVRRLLQRVKRTAERPSSE